MIESKEEMIMKWESKNGESYLHVDGYKNQYGKDVIADFAFCEHKDKIIMYSVYISSDTGELIKCHRTLVTSVMSKVTQYKSFNKFNNIFNFTMKIFTYTI